MLQAHPAVSLCAVVGVPDEAQGEEVKAFVVRESYADRLADDAERLELAKEIAAYCQERMAATSTPDTSSFATRCP